MKNRSMFRVSAVLMFALTFSMPLTILAQQKSVQTEIFEADAVQDRNAMILEAQAAAERDASNDINRWAWFGAGLGIAYVGGGVGGLAGCIIGPSDDIVPPYFHYGLAPNRGEAFGIFIGATTGVLLPIISIYTSPVYVPAQRLIGKSPEYVELYTDAYQKKMRSLKTKWAAAGVATGCTPAMIVWLSMVLNPPPDDEDDW